MRGIPKTEGMRHGYTPDHPMMAGETVTPGKFRCLSCGHVHEVTEGVKNLPVCPECLGEEWELE